MKTQVLLLVPLLLCFFGGVAFAGDDSVKVTFDTEWRGERLILPTGFAPDLSLRGIEEIRFAPGMLNPDHEEFFSYVLVFYLPKQKPLTQTQIHTELLKYYRGLAASVGRDRQPKIETDKFTLVLTPDEAKDGQCTAILDWVEPFKTGKAQKLRFVAWSKTKRGPYMSTPIIVGNVVHALGNSGIVGAYDLKTGNEHYYRRMPDVTDSFSASAVSADDRLYLGSEDGAVYVLEAGSQFKLLSTNSIDESIMATPAIGGRTLFVRGSRHLFAIGQ
ncbi:MAG: PQQ-binding-like beta-propeller repeat protein [Verrucomicrobiales bacterium]|nr:PQQ-binding-like beta-propeller repeat protein [Verrucomicrobiales bacterium]